MEFALMAPILMLVVIGAIDTGQFANVNHVVSNASREGGRLAARYDTETANEVEAHVRAYLDGEFPGLSNGINVTVRDVNGSIANDLKSIETGSQLSVEVVLEFDAVRWLSGTHVLEGREIESTTFVRRE